MSTTLSNSNTSLGKLRFATLFMIGAGLLAATLFSFPYSLSQAAIGLTVGVAIFFLRRSLLGNKRFIRENQSSGRQGYAPGVLSIVVLLAAVVVLVFSNYIISSQARIISPERVWLIYSACVAIVVESIAGYWFFATGPLSRHAS